MATGAFGMKRTALTLIAAATVAAGCGRVIMETPVHRQGDGWELTVTKITDGPNSFSMGSVNYHPDDGERFIFTYVTLHNPSRAPRTFSFNHCDLDAGNQAVLPAMVSFATLNSDGNREPELAADETIERRLVFAYPVQQSPTRLSCAAMTVPLPQF
jgi:hypothetical protein